MRRGVRIALATAAAFIAVVGGTSYLTTRGAGRPGRVGSTLPPPQTTEATTTTVVMGTHEAALSGDAGPSFEATPFTGPGWELYVGEAPNPPSATFKVCYRFDRPGEPTDGGGLGPAGCADWPAPTSGAFAGDPLLLHLGGDIVMFADLGTSPVATLRVSVGGGVRIAITPFRLPGSGKQFAAATLPAGTETATVEALDADGGVLDRRVAVAVDSTGPPWTAADPAPAWNWVATAALVRSGAPAPGLHGSFGRLARVRAVVPELRDASVLDSTSDATMEEAFFLLEDGSDTVVYVGWQELDADGVRLQLPELDATFQLADWDGTSTASRVTATSFDVVADAQTEIAVIRFFHLGDRYAADDIVTRDDEMGKITGAVLDALDLPKGASGSLFEQVPTP